MPAAPGIYHGAPTPRATSQAGKSHNPTLQPCLSPWSWLGGAVQYHRGRPGLENEEKTFLMVTFGGISVPSYSPGAAVACQGQNWGRVKFAQLKPGQVLLFHGA